MLLTVIYPGLDVISFQDKLNTQEAAVVGAEQSLVVAAQASNSPVNPVLIDQFKQLEQSINTAEVRERGCEE